MTRLNSEHLRTFLAIHDAGSVTGGGARVGRSQSATSLQIKLLEQIVGRPLFRRHGRGVVLTPAGETLLPTARAVVGSLDAALSELQGGGLRGRIRVGVPDDHSRYDLAAILADFATQHPEVELEAHCALGSEFGRALHAGRLDLAVYEVPEPTGRQEVLRRDRLRWMGRADRDLAALDPLPVAVFDRDCWWRDLALSGLEAAGRRHRIVLSSESALGVRAAVRAGIAAGLMSDTEDVTGLAPLDDLPDGYPSYLVLNRAADAGGPVCDAMGDAIRAAFIS